MKDFTVIADADPGAKQFDEVEQGMKKISRKTLLAIAVTLIMATVGIVVLTNTDRIAVLLAPKKVQPRVIQFVKRNTERAHHDQFGVFMHGWSSGVKDLRVLRRGFKQKSPDGSKRTIEMF